MYRLQGSFAGAISSRPFLLVALSVGALGGLCSDRASANGNNPPPVTKLNDQFSDWFTNTTPGYVPSPFLTDGNRNSVDALLKAQPAGTPLAIKITAPISNQTANLIFNNSKYHVSYVFGDVESTSAPQQMKTISQQVRFVNGNNNGGKTSSFNAFVGNFGFQNLEDDFTNPKSYKKQQGTHSFGGWDQDDFEKAKLNMSMPSLYPGSPSFRSPAAGNSTAPNIRSANFILPALRVSEIKANQDKDETIVPWATRFNNWGNSALDTDRNPNNGFKFIPGQAIPAAFGLPAVSANKTKDQMLSRRDFAAQIAHYRLRGASSYVLFESGVQGYSEENKRLDAKTGWTESHIDAIFTQKDATLVGQDCDSSGNNTIIVDGHTRSDESAGSLFSGVYSLSLKRMDILISNMDNDDHTLTLPGDVGGFNLKTKSFDVDGGQHLLVEYKLTTSGVNKGWSVMTKTFPFMQLPDNRNEIGIPEPTNLTVMAVLAFAGVTPRRRRRAALA